MKKIVGVWLIAFLMLVVLTLYFKKDTTQFQGIADTREIVINNENPVEVRKNYVVAGQTVKMNDLLVDLYRPELDNKIIDLTHEIEKIRAQSITDSGTILSQINQLKAQKAAKINEVNSEIDELQSKIKINKELTSELKSIPATISNDSQGSVQVKIDNLRKEMALVTGEIDLKIGQLTNVKRNQSAVQVKNLEDEIKILNVEKSKLHIISPIDGVIGSVNFKEGENVAPFSAIISLHTKSPSYIQGYIPENVYNKVKIGQSVLVVSLSDKSKQFDGTVVGVGSRIIEIPMRLWKRPDVQVWGREVQIKISENNDLLLGEKVLVHIKTKIF